VPKAKPAEWFPTAVGTKRVYRWEDGRKGGFSETVTKAETKDGVTTVTVRVVNAEGREQTDVYVVSAGGVERRDTDEFKGVNDRVLALPLKAGEPWEWDVQPIKPLTAPGGTRTPGEPEKVETPAGGVRGGARRGGRDPARGEAGRGRPGEVLGADGLVGAERRAGETEGRDGGARPGLVHPREMTLRVEHQHGHGWEPVAVSLHPVPRRVKKCPGRCHPARAVV
jgi:hypothetical protein